MTHNLSAVVTVTIVHDNCTMSGINVITTFNKINQSTEVLKAGLF